MREFFSQPNGGYIANGEFELKPRDAYELYSYVWDVLRFRQGGIWNLWKRMPPPTLSQISDEWAEANPDFSHMRDEFFHPVVLEQLGFTLDADGYLTLN